MDKIISVHVGDHWFCGCIDIKNQEVACYDSLNSVSLDHFDIVRKFMVEEYRDKLNVENDLVDWVDVDNKHVAPQQRNSVDCGVFAVKCMDWLCDDLIPDFSHRHIKYFRERVAMEIVLGRTLDSVNF